MHGRSILMGDEPAVRMVDVVKRFGNVTAVRGMNLDIADGEFFSLLGPSGCGKTTTLRMIGGFEDPTRGQIYIAGELQGYTPAYQRPVNTVFQNYALFPHLTVFRNVSFGLEMRKTPSAEARRRVAEALEMVQLKGFENRKPSQLSGGQQQRVALARALINRPQVLLLDEPLGALDLKLRKAMQLELKALQDRVGITFIYVTHDQEEALTMSDRIGVMNRGVLLQVGPARDIYEGPTSRFVANFIGDTNYFDGEVTSIEDGVAEVLIAPGCIVRAPATPDVRVRNKVTVAFRPEKVRLGQTTLTQAHNTVACTVTDIVYTGVNTSYMLRGPTGTTIVVRQQNEEVSLAPVAAPGDEVVVTWPVEAGKAFAEDEEAVESA
jgi:spermidine/putrescine transport system ATP-binding protein